MKSTVSVYTKNGEDTHYLSISEKNKEETMGKKKFLKRLLAFTLVLVLSNVVTIVERAEAATCEHLEHYTTQVYARTLLDTHKVEVLKYIYDTDGKVERVETERIECVISRIQRYYEVRCKSCNTYLATYDTISSETHSYCD